MVVFALLIINKSGGLIYNRTFHSGLTTTLSGNDYLVLAGTFHGVHAISRSLNPLASSTARAHQAANTSSTEPSTTAASTGTTPAAGGVAGSPANIPTTRPPSSTGITHIMSTRFLLTCQETATGTKFLLFTEPAQQNAAQVLEKVYELFSDYVMKNPFYNLEMPVRSEKFERGIRGWVGLR